jgi:hypothetical protein
MFSSRRSKSCEACPENNYCMGGEIYDCTKLEGMYCPAGSSSMTPCPVGYECPNPSTKKLCPKYFDCMTPGKVKADDCDRGYNCTDPTVKTICGVRNCFFPFLLKCGHLIVFSAAPCLIIL